MFLAELSEFQMAELFWAELTVRQKYIYLIENIIVTQSYWSAENLAKHHSI